MAAVEAAAVEREQEIAATNRRAVAAAAAAAAAAAKREAKRVRVEKELEKEGAREDLAVRKDMAEYLSGKTLEMPGSACSTEAAPACGYWAVAVIKSVDKYTNTWVHVVGQAKTNKFYRPIDEVIGWVVIEK